MKLARRLGDDGGSAVIEFIVLGLLAQLLILTFGLGALQGQRQQFAVTLAARQAARLVTQHPEEAFSPEVLGHELESSFDMQSGSLRLTVSPFSPQPGQLVAATAAIGAIRSTVVMRVPR
jgi:hypothetical protein